MKVLLTNSPPGRPQPAIFPLGMAYVAGALRGHQVTCLDAAAVDDPWGRLAEIAARTKPDVVGLSLRNIDTAQSYDVFSYWPSFERTVKHVRECCPNATIVVGGSGFSLFPEAVMARLPEIDYGVYLEGEQTLPDLLEHLDHPEAVPGLYYRRDGRVLFTGPREFLDLDSVGMPRLDLFDLSAYDGVRGVGIQTKRGCELDCMYCTYPFLSGRRVRLRSAERVGEEVERLCREYGIIEFFFADNVFNRPSSHAEAICRELLRRELDVRWTAYFSEDGMTANFIELALAAGCAEFPFSPDGSNDAALRALGKPVSLEEVKASYCLVERFPEARFHCGFIWNYPRTGLRDLLGLCGMASWLLRRKNLGGIDVSTMRILPNTRLRDIALEEGRIDADDDLLSPVFYDPPPWKLVSVLVNGLGRLLLTARSLARRGLRPRPASVVDRAQAG